MRHVLAVAEVYVGLVEWARGDELRLAEFASEPACWWPDGQRGMLKPDAYVWLSASTHDDAWWIEVDRATESLPTIRRKLTAYLDFARRGQVGPGGVMPRVLVTVPNEARRENIIHLTGQLPAPADELFIVVLHKDAADLLVKKLGQLHGRFKIVNRRLLRRSAAVPDSCPGGVHHS